MRGEEGVSKRIASNKGRGEGDERADGDLHRVVLGLDVETLLLERVENGRPRVESFHALRCDRRGKSESQKKGERTTRRIDPTLNLSPALSLNVPSSLSRLMNSRLCLFPHS